MRKIVISLVLITAIAGAWSIAGCRKNGSTNHKLVGKWTFQQIDDVSVINGQSYPYTQYFDGKSFIQFNSDQTFSAIIDLQYNGTWETSGNTLLLTNQGDTIPSTTLDIKTLTSRDLVLFTTKTIDSGYVQSTWQLKK